MRVAGIVVAVAVSWVAIAVANVRSDEPQPAALAIVLACFVLTIAKPRLAILWVAVFAGAIRRRTRSPRTRGSRHSIRRETSSSPPWR